MQFEPRKGHGLPHDPFRAIVAPRPIGWISTYSADGVLNLAPYSFFNAVSGMPPMVMYSSEHIKHSIDNADATREFTVSLATRTLAERMNETSREHAPEINEYEAAGLTQAPSATVRPPRVAESPAALECKVTQVITLPDINGELSTRRLVIGEVTSIYINEHYLTDGLFDMVKAGTIARCGYWDYSPVTELFHMQGPSRH